MHTQDLSQRYLRYSDVCMRVCMYVVTNGSKISIHRFIATTLFPLDKLTKNDHTHQAISMNDRLVTITGN